MKKQSLERFKEFLKEIVTDDDWEYEDGSPMTKDAQVVLDTLTPISTDNELPPEYKDILWWLPGERGGWQKGFYGVDEHYPPGGFVSGGCHWFVYDDGPTWWMRLPPSPEEKTE